MCKESISANVCPGCGMRIQFYENHIKHCILLRVKRFREAKKERTND